MANLLQASASSEMVKLETMASSKSIPWSESRIGFPVLVQVTALMQRTPRHSLDLVAVLDTSRSLKQEGRLDCVKQAMIFIIDNLGDNDRLSILPIRGTKNYLLMSLMSPKNRENMKSKVSKLCTWHEAGNDFEYSKVAAKILRDRGLDESSSRIGRIIYLCDFDYMVTDIDPEFPTNTFGLGLEHSPETMQYISIPTLGVYSYVNKNLEMIKDAFAQLIGGLTSVTAIDLELELKTDEGVSISSIESGSYKQSISPGNQQGSIEINDLSAGEKKNFIVYLTIPEGEQNLITVGGSYKNLNDIIHLDKSKVVVKRPWGWAWPWARTPAGEVVHPEVAAELARLRLVKGVSNMANSNQFDKSNVQRLWDSANVPEKTMSDLGKDVSVLEGDHEVKSFMLSWLTSHLIQRATTKGAPSESGDFQTTAMKKMLRIADNKKLEPEPEPEPELQPLVPLELSNKLKTMGRKGITWAKSNPYYRALLSVTLLPVAALLIIMYVRTYTTNTTTVIIEKALENSSSRLDLSNHPGWTKMEKPLEISRSSPLGLSNHPGWPKMKKALEVTMLRSTEEVGIASLFNGASLEDMTHAANRYLYLAIVHASVLGSRCKSEDVAAISQLEEKVRSLEAENKHLLLKSETLAKEKVELAVATADCAATRENGEALQRANTRIKELEKQLQDKKAFADSLLSEVTNADAHLKTCTQRMDMLEAKNIRTLKRLGPWGGQADGVPRDVVVKPWHLESITVGVDDNVDAISFTYLDKDGNRQDSGQWGLAPAGRTLPPIILGPAEVVTEVSGTYLPQSLSSIKFVTNLQTYGPYGQVLGTPFKTLMPKDNIVVGFHAVSGKYLDKIGVYTI